MIGELLRLEISQESLDNVMEVYGNDFLDNIFLKIDLIKKNILIWEDYRLNYDEVFGRYPELFLLETKTLKEKMKRLLMELGENYQDQLEEDLSLYERILNIV